MNTGYSELRRRLAFGTGIGIEIGDEDLKVSVVRVRPRGPAVLGTAEIRQFRSRPAGEWGAEYAAFLKRHGVSHLPATVLVPRRDVIVRLVNLPGVAERDLASAVRLQIDSLHPWGEDDAAYTWSRVGASGAVLIAIVRRAVLDDCMRLFAEAGIRVADLTFSAAALHPVLRLFNAPPSGGFVALAETAAGAEVYGESETRPVFSAIFDAPSERARVLAMSELRLPPESEPIPAAALVPKPKTAPKDFDLEAGVLPYAAAIAGACSLLRRPVNLLPASQRASTSRLRYVPTAVLAGLLAVAVIAMAGVKPLEDRKYMGALAQEIARLEPEARKAAALDHAINDARTRSRQIDAFRRRTLQDLGAVQELTKTLAPPAYLEQLELTRTRIVLGGVSEQAAGLLKLIDESPHFRGSEFTIPLARAAGGDAFRLQAAREGTE